MRKLKICAIIGSLREKSFNRMLMNSVMESAGDSCEIDLLPIQDVPLYNQDDEEHRGLPEAVTLIQEQLLLSDGLLIATPEYNHSMPGVLKNAIDWVSRPPKKGLEVFSGLPVGIMGATPSGRGTIGSQEAWLMVWNSLHVNLFNAAFLGIPRAHEVFAEDGKIKDSKVQKQVMDYMKSYVDFVREHSRRR